MSEDPSSEAGRLYQTAAASIRNGFAVKILAGHVAWMLGDNDWHRPVWRERAVPPDGKTFDTPTFDEYLLRPAREGLGMPSLLSVHNICGADPSHGARAVHLMRQEIRDYNKLIKRDQRLVQDGLPDLADKGGDHGNQYTGGKRRSDNITLPRGTSDTYLAARLRRDDLERWQAYMAGEYNSVRAAAIAAGIVKPRATIPSDMPIEDLAGQLRRRFTPDQCRRLAALLTDGNA